MALFILICVLPVWGRGELILIGGGPRTQSLLKKIVEISRNKILIVPLASEIPSEVAMSISNELISVGAKNINVFSCIEGELDQERCLLEIQNANLIFFTGGSQNKLMNAFRNTKSLALIRNRFQKDLSLSGTSAGTAIMSDIMLTGNPKHPYTSIEGVRPQMVETTTGFGFVNRFILDQHFLMRNRQNRLLSIVLDHAPSVGVGIDESTAIHMKNDHSFEVIGDSSVMVYDARKASIQVNSDNSYETSELKVFKLSSGDVFSL